MNQREWALPVYTILMQLSVGSMLAFWVIRAVFLPKFGEEELERMMRNPVAILMITILTAMVGSFFHLSRPAFSFLALINLGKSWLSREILFTVLLFGAVAVLWLLQAHVDHHKQIKSLLGWAAIGFGISATYCMTQLYILPTQASWDSPFTTLSFFSSMVLLGASAGITMLTVDMRYTQILNPKNMGAQAEIISRSLPGFALTIILIVAAILAQYVFLIETLSVGGPTAQASLQLYLGLYRPLLIFRLVTMLAGAGWLVIAIIRTFNQKINLQNFAFHAYMTCLLLLVSEILGRFLFYATHIRLGI